MVVGGAAVGDGAGDDTAVMGDGAGLDAGAGASARSEVHPVSSTASTVAGTARMSVVFTRSVQGSPTATDPNFAECAHACSSSAVGLAVSVA